MYNYSEDENYIYIENLKLKNKLVLSISKINSEIILLNEQTSNLISLNNKKEIYGIMGIINISLIPCLIIISKVFDYTNGLGQIYKIEKLNYIILNKDYNNQKEIEIEENFKNYSNTIIQSSIFFSYILDLSNKDDKYLYNYDMLNAFIENDNLKYYYCKCIQGHIGFFNMKFYGYEFLFYFISKKNIFLKNYEVYKTKILYNLSNGDSFSFKVYSTYDNHLSKKFNNELIDLLNFQSNIIIFTNNLNLIDEKTKEENLTVILDENNINIPIENLLNIGFNYKKSTNYFSSLFYKEEDSIQKVGCIIITSGYEEMVNILEKIINENILLCFNNYNIGVSNTYYNLFNQEKGKKITNKEIINNIRFNELLKKIIEMYKISLKRLESFRLIDERINSNITAFNQITSKIENINKLSIYILTYNIAAQNLSDFNIESILFPEKHKKYFTKEFSPDFICIGFQEIVELNVSNVFFKSNNSLINSLTEKISKTLFSKYQFQLLYKEHMVGVLFLFYVKTPLIPLISEINVSFCKTGFIGLSGNKGYLMLQFNFKNKYFVFTTGHLTAGENKENLTQRQNELNSILTTYFSNSKRPEYLLNDFYFIFGDLNFRIKIHKDNISKQDYIDKNNLLNIKDTLFLSDELHIFLSNNKKINEGKINFLPTFKYIKNSNNYDLKKRIPSWTDRILFGNSKGNYINQIFYDDIDVLISDHRPVSSLFEINI